MLGKFYLRRKILELEERVAMLEIKQKILLEALAETKEKGK